MVIYKEIGPKGHISGLGILQNRQLAPAGVFTWIFVSAFEYPPTRCRAILGSHAGPRISRVTQLRINETLACIAFAWGYRENLDVKKHEVLAQSVNQSRK